MAEHNLKYKKFDQLLSEVKGDFESYNLEDLIKPHQLIKVAKRINYDLGLRINKTKNIVIEIDHGKAKLPEDFLTLNYAYLLGRFSVSEPLPQGTHTEEVPVEVPTYFQRDKKIDVCAVKPECPIDKPECPDPCQSPEPCGCKSCGCDTWINCKGTEMKLVQKVGMTTRKWTEFHKIELNGDDQLFDPLCPNKRNGSSNKGFIRDGYVYLPIKSGELYLNYQGLLEDEEGNLLVLEHPMINEYYEYAIKERILEVLMGNNELLNMNFVNRIDTKLRFARNQALSIVNTPDFSELKRVWQANRKAMFNKYYKMFS